MVQSIDWSTFSRVKWGPPAALVNRSIDSFVGIDYQQATSIASRAVADGGVRPTQLQQNSDRSTRMNACGSETPPLLRMFLCACFRPKTKTNIEAAHRAFARVPVLITVTFHPRPSFNFACKSKSCCRARDAMPSPGTCTAQPICKRASNQLTGERCVRGGDSCAGCIRTRRWDQIGTSNHRNHQQSKLKRDR